jgi:hypothetical protein
VQFALGTLYLHFELSFQSLFPTFISCNSRRISELKWQTDRSQEAIPLFQ